MDQIIQQSAPASANVQEPFVGAVLGGVGVDVGPDRQSTPGAGVIFDRYAGGIVGANSHLYDTVEVHGVKNYETDAECGTCYEVNNEDPTLFSVYVHLKDGGVECVGDFSHYQDAENYGIELAAQYGWSMQSYVPEQLRKNGMASMQ